MDAGDSIGPASHPSRPGRLDAAVGYLRNETFGGFLLLLATALALLWANGPWAASYETISETVIGPAALHLDLDVQTWAKDGLLAVFFFVAGLELKRELVVGELRDPRRAMLPLLAAIAGMVVPILVYLVVARGADGWQDGWAIPTATDIAFALGVLSLVGSGLPRNLRTFLLSLAVVDDLGAIILIAVLFTDDVSFLWLGVSAVLLAGYAGLQRRRVRTSFVYVPLALLTWAAVHESGVHATIAGVALGLLTRVRRDPGESSSPAERLEHRVQPFSATICVPLFALFAAGVPISAAIIGDTLANPIAQAIMLGLIVGKPLGVVGGAFLAVRTGLAKLPRMVEWRDIAGVGVVAGVGFTVSLLISELAFEGDEALSDTAKSAVLLGSSFMALLGAAVLFRRSRRIRMASLADRVDDTLEITPGDLADGA